MTLQDMSDRSEGATAAQPAPAGILLAVYNGADGLPAQLDSIAAQDDPDWRLLVSDDGSHDDSDALIAAFAGRMQGRRVVRLTGPGQGAARNFLFLIRQWRAHLPPGSLMAFCDQDDVWLTDKLGRGRAALAAVPENVPALYCLSLIHI